jgi:hypothetical protein
VLQPAVDAWSGSPASRDVTGECDAEVKVKRWCGKAGVSVWLLAVGFWLLVKADKKLGSLNKSMGISRLKAFDGQDSAGQRLALSKSAIAARVGDALRAI